MERSGKKRGEGDERAQEPRKGEDEGRKREGERGKSKLNIKLHFAIGGSRRKRRELTDRNSSTVKRGLAWNLPFF